MFEKLFYRGLGLIAFLLCTPSYALWFDEIRDPESLQIFCRLKAREFEVLSHETDHASEREKTLQKIARMWTDLPEFYADPEKPLKYAQDKSRPQTSTPETETTNTEMPQFSTSATTQISPSVFATPVGTPLDFLNDYLKELSELESAIYPLDSLNFLMARTVRDYFDIQTDKYSLLARITAKRASLLDEKANALNEKAQETKTLSDREKILGERLKIIAEQERCIISSEKHSLIAKVWQKIKGAKLALFEEGERSPAPPSLFRSLWIRPSKDDPYHHGDALTSSRTGSMLLSTIGPMTSSLSCGLIRPSPLITFDSQAVWEEYTFTGMNLRGLSDINQNTPRVFSSVNEARFHYGQVILERLKDQIHKRKRVRIIDYEQKPQSPPPETMTLSYEKSTEEDSLENQLTVAARHILVLQEEMANLPTSVRQQSKDGLFSMIYYWFSSEPSPPQIPKDYTPWLNYKAKVDYLRHKMNLSPAQVDKVLEEGYL